MSDEPIRWADDPSVESELGCRLDEVRALHRGYDLDGIRARAFGGAVPPAPPAAPAAPASRARWWAAGGGSAAAVVIGVIVAWLLGSAPEVEPVAAPPAAVEERLPAPIEAPPAVAA